MIRTMPIILNKWSPTARLTKDNHKSIPVWVKMHDVPMAAFTADGLSIIATKIGNPLMLDSYSSTMCNDSWGRSSYARAMIEVHAESELKESVIVAVSNLEGEGYTCETVTIEYEWKPPQCSTCQVLGHSNDQCPLTVKELPKKTGEVQADGFQKVKSRNKGKKQNDRNAAFKRKTNFIYRPIAKQAGVVFGMFN